MKVWQGYDVGTLGLVPPKVGQSGGANPSGWQSCGGKV